MGRGHGGTLRVEASAAGGSSDNGRLVHLKRRRRWKYSTSSRHSRSSTPRPLARQLCLAQAVPASFLPQRASQMSLTAVLAAAAVVVVAKAQGPVALKALPFSMADVRGEVTRATRIAVPARGRQCSSAAAFSRKTHTPVRPLFSFNTRPQVTLQPTSRFAAVRDRNTDFRAWHAVSHARPPPLEFAPTHCWPPTLCFLPSPSTSCQFELHAPRVPVHSRSQHHGLCRAPDVQPVVRGADCRRCPAVVCRRRVVWYMRARPPTHSRPTHAFVSAAATRSTMVTILVRSTVLPWPVMSLTSSNVCAHA